MGRKAGVFKYLLLAKCFHVCCRVVVIPAGLESDRITCVTSHAS